MKVIKYYHNFEKAQILPMVALMLVALVAFAALILDGGAIMSNKRSAQAAADAGALAGAHRECYNLGNTVSVAQSYAIENGAVEDPLPIVDVDNKEVTVTATVEHESFFAKIFGVKTLTAKAKATAGCYGVEGIGVVPVAFNCTADTIGGHLSDGRYDCIMLGLDWNTQLFLLLDGKTVNIGGTNYSKSGNNILDADGAPPLNEMYIIITATKTCESQFGDVNCDLNDDGKDDIRFGGDRGWLYLTPSTSSIGQEVLHGPKTPYNLDSHVWLTGGDGNPVSIYKDMINAGYPGSVVKLPVFNVFCPGNPRTYVFTEDDKVDPMYRGMTCVDAAHYDARPPVDAFHWPPEPLGGDNFDMMRNDEGDNYHILNFAPFYVSCIDKKGECPGYQAAYESEELNTTDLKGDEPVIEGFFVTDYDLTSVDEEINCDINLGNCTISLKDSDN